MMPVMYAIRHMDESVANVGKVWMTWWMVQQSLEMLDELKDSVVKLWQTTFNGKQRKILLTLCHQCWATSHSPMHSTTYLLDLEYWNLDL